MTRSIAVHPNSTAARKWRRSSWTTTLSASELAPTTARPKSPRHAAVNPVELLFVRAAAAKRRGQHERANALRAAAMRLQATSFRC